VSEEHKPVRPSWACDSCGEPWPCDPAREQLASELRGSYLTLNMSIYMINAARENPLIPPSELYQRFLAWARRPPDVSAAAASREPAS
jgi:hypothetical protein